jgi:EAL domain-containing protein (putative c-di-GMP-specific phosphodiesterase class I)
MRSSPATTGAALPKSTNGGSPTARSSAIPGLTADCERLRLALETGRIYPVFQPIVTLPSGSISSLEALARWHDDDLGAIPPSHFIPIAEKSGLMAALTSRIIQTACEAASQWDGEFRLAFNISPLQFRSSELSCRIEEIVRPTGFPLSRIQLEITESAVIDDLELARASIFRLKALGVQIVLDDFGTGYSSLTRLQALPSRPPDVLPLGSKFIPDALATMAAPSIAVEIESSQDLAEDEPVSSAATEAAVAASFNALSASIAMQSAEAIDAMTRKMLRPMIKTWLDDNLPALVERLVRIEIQRVARGGR